MTRKESEEAREFNTLQALGFELESPHDTFTYQPDSSGTASGIVGQVEYGITPDVDASGYQHGSETLVNLDEGGESVPEESVWSQHHRLPVDDLVSAETAQSNELLVTTLQSALEHYPALKGVNAEIASGDAVLLSGIVPTLEAKKLLAEMVEGIAAVRSVYDEVTIQE